MTIVPVIQTSRLVLRGHRPDDFAEYARMWADPELTRYIGNGSPRTRAESWASFLRQVGQWHMGGFGSWVVDEKTSGRQVGNMGYIERRLEGQPLLEAPELGWMFDTSVKGRGYASEALGAALAWGKERFGPARVVAVILEDNVASIRVAEKNGFREFERVSDGGERIHYERVL